MERNFLTKLKEKKKVMKLSMAALVGAVTLRTMSGGALISNTAHAELNANQVVGSLGVLSDEVNKSDDKVMSKDDAAQIKAATEQAASPSASVSSVDSAVGGVAVAKNAKDADNASEQIKSEDEVVLTRTQEDDLKLVQQEAVKTSSAEVVKSKKLKNAQKLYALQAANMQDPFALLNSGVIENLRLSGNISQISVKEGERKYIEDKGDAISNVLRILFPSSAGELNTEYNGYGTFSFSREPLTPEMMAKIFAILNDYRNGKIVRDKSLKKDDKIYFSTKFTNDDRELFLNFYGLGEKINEIEGKSQPLMEVKSANEERLQELNKQIEDLDQKLSVIGPIEDLPQMLSMTVYRVFYGEDFKEKERLEAEKKALQKSIDDLNNKIGYYKNYKKCIIAFIDNLLSAVYDSGYGLQDIAMQIAAEEKKQKEIQFKVGESQEQQFSKRQLHRQMKHSLDLIKGLKDKLSELERQFKQLNYPQYLTEKILMAYLIKTLNTDEEVKTFYSEFVNSLSKNKSHGIEDSNDLEREISDESIRLNNVNAVVNSIVINLDSPYKNVTYENGLAFSPIFDKSSNKVTFTSGTFADCADTALRHVINMLSYSQDKQWYWILDGSNKDELKEKLNLVTAAINNNGSVEFYDLRTRFQLFFLYQSEHGADDKSTMARTLWEYVICNMTRESIDEYNMGKKEADKMYAIRYCNKKSYELDTGYINMLKLMYNMALALRLQISEADKKLEVARESISGLENLIEDGFEADKEKRGNNSIFRKTLKDVFSLFWNKGIVKIAGLNKCSVEKIEGGKKDIFGSGLGVIYCDQHEIKRRSFKINQKTCHASVAFNPYKIPAFSKMFYNYINDDYVNLLLKTFDKEYKFCGRSLNTMLYRIFSGESLSEFEKTDMYRKYKALHVFYALRGEQENYYRVESEVTDDVFSGVKLVKIKNSEDTLLSVLYGKFLSGYDSKRDIYIKFNSCGLEQKVYDSQRVEVKGFSYIKLNEKNEVKLLIKDNTRVKDGTLTIPSKVWDEKDQELKVVRVGSLCEEVGCEKVVFADGFNELQIDPWTFKRSCINEVQFNSDLEKLTIGKEAFNDSHLKKITIPKSVRDLSIGEGAFIWCKFTEFDLEGNRQLNKLEIIDKAFFGSYLKKITIPKNVRDLSIGESAFEACSDFTDFEIEVDSILESLNVFTRAFKCSDLKGFTIPKSVKSLGMQGGIFEDCREFKELIIEAGSQAADWCVGWVLHPENVAVYIPDDLRDLLMQKFSYGNHIYYKDENDLLYKRARQNHPDIKEFVDAINDLAGRYENGIGVPQDQGKAFYLYQRAADDMKKLAESYEQGNSDLPKDTKTANEIYERVADIINKLAQCYENGIGVPQDQGKAFELYQQAAKRGHAYAKNNLARCYENGIGVSQDKTKAFELYQQVSDDMKKLAERYEKGDSGLLKDTKKAMELYEKVVDIINKLAQCYEDGIGVPQDKTKAIELYEKLVDDMKNLAGIYEYGDSVLRDSTKAFELYEKMSNVSDVLIEYYEKVNDQKKITELYRKKAAIMNKLAMYYENGIGVVKDEEKAVKLYQDATDKENTDAMNNLARCYENGIGVPQDKTKAFELYKEAAEKGNIEAKSNLARCYENGIGVPQDKTKVFELYQQVADDMKELAKRYEQGDSGLPKDTKKSMELYEKVVDIISKLAQCYEDGIGVDKNLTRAFELYRDAIRYSRNADARNNLARCYENGIGVDKDLMKAFYLYQDAADNGHVAAINNLARCYEYGIFVNKDPKKAFELYQDAANNGHAAAMNKLAMYYEIGIGVTKDKKKAFELYQNAGAKGNIDAINNLARCYKNGIGVVKALKQADELYQQAENLSSILSKT